ncbi:MAG: phosphoribosylaminoimidazolesuccinocarboxamide synthase [Syntrophales bacterium]|nr:phosphoribosylaminoimidazolesuccinocarboxamide synthase [Syntrophales bacterium]
MEYEGLMESSFDGLDLVNRGKVRDVYQVEGRLLIVATDRVSAFDVVMPNPIPGKGAVLTRMSVYWFRLMEEIVENHLITTNVDDYPEACRPYSEILRGRSMLVHRAEPLPVECVVRGYLAGSGWKDYSGGRPVSGIDLPRGLKEFDRLEEPIFTPSTKAARGMHDEPISREDMVDLVGVERAREVIDISLRIYQRASEIAEKAGIVIADTKMEFGVRDGRIILIDELLTPDSSRFWPVEDLEAGGKPASFDKQVLRDYLMSSRWNMEPPAPALPDNIITRTKERYHEVLRRITGDDEKMN